MNLTTILFLFIIPLISTQYTCDTTTPIIEGINPISVTIESSKTSCFNFSWTETLLEPHGYKIVVVTVQGVNYTSVSAPRIDSSIWYQLSGDGLTTSWNSFLNTKAWFVEVDSEIIIDLKCEDGVCVSTGDVLGEILVEVIVQDAFDNDNCGDCIGMDGFWCESKGFCVDWNDRYQDSIHWPSKCRGNTGEKYVRPDMLGSCSGLFDFRPPRSTVIGIDAFSDVSDHFLNILNEFRKSRGLGRIFKAPQSVQETLMNEIPVSSNTFLVSEMLEEMIEGSSVTISGVFSSDFRNGDAWDQAYNVIYQIANSQEQRLLSNTLNWVYVVPGEIYFQCAMIENVVDPSQYFKSTVSSCQSSETTISNAVCDGDYWKIKEVDVLEPIQVATGGFIFEGDLSLSTESSLNFAIQGNSSGKLIVEGCATLSGNIALEVDELSEGEISLMDYRCSEGEFTSLEIEGETCGFEIEERYTSTQFSLLFSPTEETCGTTTLLNLIMLTTLSILL